MKFEQTQVEIHIFIHESYMRWESLYKFSFIITAKIPIYKEVLSALQTGVDCGPPSNKETDKWKMRIQMAKEVKIWTRPEQKHFPQLSG